MPSSFPLTRLVEATGQSPPPGAVVETVRTGDGLKLRAARWDAPTAKAKGTVCIFNGRSEFIEKYFETIRDLRARGFCVAIFDWRGQGGSQRLMGDHRRGHVDRFADYRHDVDAFMRGLVLPDCPRPYYALAHSMGGAVLFDLLSDRPLWFERLVASAPMIGLPDVMPGSRFLASALRGVGFGRNTTPGFSLKPVAKAPYAGNALTRDPARYSVAGAFVDAEPMLGLGGPTIGWVDEAFSVMERLADPDFGRRWRTPTLIVAAGVDRVVSTPVAESFGRRLRAARTVVIPGALHELLMERDSVREQFFAAFDAFIPGRAD